MESAMKVMGVEEVEKYFLRLQNTIAQYIATCLILELCMEADWWTVTRVTYQ